MFILAVDDFDIKYYNIEDADHLFNALQDTYSVSTYSIGRNYCGLRIDWYYSQGCVEISMSGYILEVLKNFVIQHPKKHNTPHISGQLLCTAKKINMHYLHHLYHSSTPKASSGSRPSMAHSYIIIEP